MLNEVKNRLASLGFAELDIPDSAIEYAIALSGDVIMNKTNRSAVPDELRRVHIEMAAGFALRDRKTEILSSGSYGFSAAIKSISEGDMSVTFAAGSEGARSPEARFDELIKNLTEPDASVFAAHRRFKW